jgi:hypothetical protein
MSIKYKFGDNDKLYFISFAVVHCLPEAISSHPGLLQKKSLNKRCLSRVSALSLSLAAKLAAIRR